MMFILSCWFNEHKMEQRRMKEEDEKKNAEDIKLYRLNGNHRPKR